MRAAEFMRALADIIEALERGGNASSSNNKDDIIFLVVVIVFLI